MRTREPTYTISMELKWRCVTATKFHLYLTKIERLFLMISLQANGLLGAMENYKKKEKKRDYDCGCIYIF